MTRRRDAVTSDALDLTKPMHLRATMAREGIHDLNVYWSPDTDGDVDPLDDPEVRATVRSFLRRLWVAAEFSTRGVDLGGGES